MKDQVSNLGEKCKHTPGSRIKRKSGKILEKANRNSGSVHEAQPYRTRVPEENGREMEREEI